MTFDPSRATVKRDAAPAEHVAISEPSVTDWDTFVLQHPLGHLLQLSAWGNLKASAGWTVQRIAVVGPTPDASQSGQLVLLAGVQVLFRTRYGVSVAYVPRGPLFAGDASIDDLLLAALARAARRRWSVFLRVEPNLAEDQAQASTYHTWLLLKDFRPTLPIQPRSTIHLDLMPAPDRLFAGFSKGHRADIRRAERQGVHVRVGSSDDIATFYAIMQATGARAAFGIHSQAYYHTAFQQFQHHACLLLAEQAGQPVAAHMVFSDGHAGLYLYSGATDVGLKVGANHLLQWHAIQWAREQGCRFYDLWGIPDALGQAACVADPAVRATLEAEAAQDALIGVYRFKKGFGGAVVRYLPAYDQVFLPPLYALWRHRFNR